MTSDDGYYRLTYLGQRVVRTEAQRLANAVFARESEAAFHPWKAV